MKYMRLTLLVTSKTSYRPPAGRSDVPTFRHAFSGETNIRPDLIEGFESAPQGEPLVPADLESAVPAHTKVYLRGRKDPKLVRESCEDVRAFIDSWNRTGDFTEDFG